MPDRITKFVESLNAKLRKQLKKRLEGLKKTPYLMSGVKKLGEVNNLYRLRMGKIRIIYKITQEDDIEIVDIDYRGNIY